MKLISTVATFLRLSPALISDDHKAKEKEQTVQLANEINHKTDKYQSSTDVGHSTPNQ